MRTWNKRTFVGLCILMAAAAAGAPAAADQDFTLTWTLTSLNYLNIENLSFWVRTEQSFGPDWTFTYAFPQPGFVMGSGETFLSFPTFSAESVLGSLIIGSAADDSGQDHLVLFVNPTWANSAMQVDWSDLVQGPDEQSLLDDVNSAYQNGDVYDFVTINSAVPQMLIAPSGDFTAVAFSEGSIVGGGTSSVASSVPESSTWTMMLAGFASLAAVVFGAGGIAKAS